MRESPSVPDTQPPVIARTTTPSKRSVSKQSPLTHAQRDSLPNAGFWRRIGAMIYDGLLVIALVMSLLLIGVALSNDRIESAYSQPLAIVASYGFFAFFWLRNRQTLGMLAWQLEIQPNSVAGPDGDPIIPPLTVTMITLRFVGACAGALAFGMGYLWILIDPQNRSWSDLLSGTRIVRVPNQFAENR